MASHLRKRWDANFQGMSRRDRRGCDYDAYLADPLADWDLSIPADVAADVADAEAAVRALNDAGTTHVSLEGLARFLLRAESVGSSKIEGFEAAARRLARAEAAIVLGGEANDRVAAEVIGNIAAMESAVELATSADPFELDDLLSVHRTLMDNSPSPELGGVVREEQNWIGGNSFNPCSAAFVPPPHEYLPDLLADLLGYVNGDEHSPLVQAAIAHAQFETLHPFVDGNGRTGRALIHVVLRRRGLAPTFVPPISLVLATWSDDYVNGLMTYRHLSEPESTQRSATAVEWLRMFATATSRACQDAGTYSDDIGELTAIWRSKLGRVRANSSADLLLRVLPGAPIVTVGSASKLIGRSKARTTDAVNALARAGILQQRNVGRHRYRVFEATEVLDLFTGLERVLASQTGDTTSGPPIRRVPQHPGSAEPTGQTRSHPPIPSSASASASASSRPDDSPPRQRHHPEPSPMNHDDKVGHAGWLDDLDELDRHELIEQITVDAYGDEAYWSFHQVIGEHVQFPVRASIAGADVTVTEIDFDGDERRGLTATAHRDDHTWSVSLLDVEFDAGQPRIARLADAYRRWLGIDK